MRKNNFRSVVTLGLAAVMAMATLAGCGTTSSEDATAQQTQEAVAQEEVAQENKEATLTAPYFSKGVYFNYSRKSVNPAKTNFYVFSDDAYGYTADGENGDDGRPFDIEQADGKVLFTFGGKDEGKDTLVITGGEDGKIYGYYEGDPDNELVFEPVLGADPEGFSGENYLKAASGENLVYKSANGWSVKYDPSVITVNEGGPLTTFVYTGECPGTCMITATYDATMDAKAKADEFAKMFSDNGMVSECLFPGTEDVDGYYVDAFPGQLGPGYYESAFVRDYMDGSLMFEFTDHVGGDDAIDMPVSDALAEIIDSLSFEQ